MSEEKISCNRIAQAFFHVNYNQNEKKKFSYMPCIIYIRLEIANPTLNKFLDFVWMCIASIVFWDAVSIGYY